MTEPPQDQSGESEESRVDLDELIARNAPLADLIRTLQLSNTWRDNPAAIAEDLSIAMKARDESSDLAEAFDRYEASREETSVQQAGELSRRDLAAQILSEIQPPQDDS